MGGKKKHIPYHQAFCAATELELKANKNQLHYYREHIVNMVPRQIDLLIVKTDDVRIQSGLGAIFKKYNLFEYKSPDKALGIEQYHKALAYVVLLEEYQKKKEECSMDDFTISFVRKRMPRKPDKAIAKAGLGEAVSVCRGLNRSGRSFECGSGTGFGDAAKCGMYEGG